jgi:hypothetical protein
MSAATLPRSDEGRLESWVLCLRYELLVEEGKHLLLTADLRRDVRTVELGGGRHRQRSLHGQVVKVQLVRQRGAGGENITAFASDVNCASITVCSFVIARPNWTTFAFPGVCVVSAVQR